MFIFKVFLIIILSTCALSQQDQQDEKPFLRIVAPKYLCEDPSQLFGNETESSNKLTIGLQTREGQRLRYKISIGCSLLDGFQNQRHTLSIWKNIRELQGKFATKDVSNEISLRNQIEIDAMELTPQVIYTFKIIGYDENNKASDEQNFTITYKGDQLQAVHSNVGEGVSLLLYGPETFYNDLEFLAVAEVLFCNPISDYYYQWAIKGISSDSFATEFLNVKGSVLRLPPVVLEEDKDYEFVATIFNNNSEPMATISLPVTVLSKQVSTQNIPADCNVGVNREVPFVTALYRNSNTQSIDVKWMCSIEESECPNVFSNSSSSFGVSAVFPSEGRYTLNTDVTIKGATISSNTSVLADPKVIPHVEIKYFPQQPMSVTESTEIVATIMDLVPKCIAYWNIITEGDFAKPKNESLVNTGLISIKDYEEHFLLELVDYDNNTLSKDTTLQIPPNSLHPDSKYKFRLNILCPEPISEIMSTTGRKNVTTYFDIVFETNGAPVPFPLLVTPLKGIPMKDEFTFKTGAAKERQTDYPLRYSFSYQVDNLVVNVGTFYEFQVARTQLPYSNEILTFMEVTDNNNATAYIQGPKIKANMAYKFTKVEIAQKFSEIKGTLKRNEYSKTLNAATVLILTTRKYSSPQEAKDYEKSVYEMLNKELESLKSTSSNTYVHRQNVIEYVKMIKNLLNILPVYNEKFIENVLSLTEFQGRRVKRMLLSNSLRNKNIMTATVDPEYIKNVLALSDILISSSNKETVQREKKKYVDKIHQFITSLCQNPNLNSQVIKSKFAAFEASKIYSRQLFMEPQKFPKDTANAMFSFNPNFPYKFVCIGKVKLLIDMFDNSTKDSANDVVYETRILDDDANGQKVVLKSENVGEYFMMEMPVKNGNANEQSCFIWTKSRWSTDECIRQAINQTRIACKCKTSNGAAIVKYKRSTANVKLTTVSPGAVAKTSTSTKAFVPGMQNTPKMELTTLSNKVSTQKTGVVTASTTLVNKVSSTKTEITTALTTQIVTTQDSKTSTTKNANDVETFTTTTSIQKQVFTESSIKSTRATEEGQQSISTKQSTGPRSTIEPGKVVLSTKKIESTTASNTISTVKITAKGSNKEPENSDEETVAVKTTTKQLPKPGTTTISSVIVTKESGNKTNSTSANVVESANIGLNIWFVILILCLFFGLVAFLLVFYKCRRYSESSINLPMRHPSNSIKYAKYHDEFIMRG